LIEIFLNNHAKAISATVGWSRALSDAGTWRVYPECNLSDIS